MGLWKRPQWLNLDACNFFSVQCALLNMFLVDLQRSAMLSLNMSTCSIWVAGRAKVHKRIRSVASERVCKLSASYHKASNSAISYVTGPLNEGSRKEFWFVSRTSFLLSWYATSYKFTLNINKTSVNNKTNNLTIAVKMLYIERENRIYNFVLFAACISQLELKLIPQFHSNLSAFCPHWTLFP